MSFGPHIESIPDRALYSMSYLKKITMTGNVTVEAVFTALVKGDANIRH